MVNFHKNFPRILQTSSRFPPLATENCPFCFDDFSDITGYPGARPVMFWSSIFLLSHAIDVSSGNGVRKFQKCTSKRVRKWKKVDLEGPDPGQKKLVRALYYINFSSRIQPRIRNYPKHSKKDLKIAIFDFFDFHQFHLVFGGPFF